MNQKKTQTVTELQDKIGKTKSVVLADYRGLTHKQAEELHKAVKKVAGEFTVVKNTLLKVAAKQAGNEQLANNPVNGPIGALFAYEDEFAPLKELFKYAKTVGYPNVKLSYINNTQYDAEKTMAIAKLPDLKTLRGQFVFTLNANLTKLAYVLSQIKKENN
ncbi:50S ribosomal protein L10 [Candidatus Gottesmanbacteria bacterium RIFCSPHIGHO2_01_FULL_42_12]|uniref:Large ribosomal subunit protein uL10 n=1 Tax=Candidatus Gottesmanbacteria bacterium RIFCSPHIGHO2_01_FULL_42_12 TaxID=1798377 RepID=A0A1F5Z5P7_9BACT|nr:MAG: 50S ribosomal protein L10 [Candidatus Gottesmanbacteria bacterium RIFCSPHIGHO2_01_FULL_42_12]